MSTFYSEQQRIKETADPLDFKMEGTSDSSEKSNPVKMNILSK